MNSKALTWLAGLLEGEGCFTVGYQNGRRYSYPVIQLSMVDRDVIDRAAALMGNPAVCSRVLKSGKTNYQIRVTGTKARELMTELKPLMGARRQARIQEVLNI